MSNDLLCYGPFAGTLGSMATHFELHPEVRFGYSGPCADAFAGRLKRLIRLRRKREAAFGADLFADPAWDMMLDLCLAAETGRKVSVSNLCIAAAVPATTALRWIGALEGKGLVQREPDAQDQRRAFLSLTDETYATLKDLLCQWMGLPGARGSLSVASAS